MNEIDMSKPGGRIRACRQEMNLTLSQLADSIKVSSNYLSVVERGIKNPSDKVLHKIADVAKVSYWWLKTGQEESPMKEAPPAPPQKPSYPMAPQKPTYSLNHVPADADIDVPLFLSLAIQSVPGMSKEKLAVILDAPPEDMEKILFGDDHGIYPNWKNYFSFLAQKMDLPTVCKKVHALDLFLQNENRDKGENRLLELANRYIGSEYEYYRFDSAPENTFLTSKILYSAHIVLLKSDAPLSDDDNYGSRRFSFYRFDGIDKTLFESIMSSHISYCKEYHCDSTLVFDDDSILDLFKQAYEQQQASISPSAGGDCGKDGSLPTVALLLVDRETWEPRGDIIRLEGND